ncbi:MAG TPA: ankyrin repeat domain-containing protein [Tenuifilaceae bacterium]|nr:ankyrin repeat domain-containing protein [Tenuifilaceae bacterium]
MLSPFINHIAKGLFFALLTVLTFHDISAQEKSNDVIAVQLINSNNFSRLDSLVNRVGVNSLFFNNTQTLLHIAVNSNNYEVSKWLIQKGANCNLLINNLTPLIIAAMNNYKKVAELLVAGGADVNFYNNNRNTPLYYAARFGNVDVVKLLIKKKANPYIENFHGYNCLDIAKQYEKSEVANLLVDYFAKYAKGMFESTYDGPHIEWQNSQKISFYYLINDSIQGRYYKVKQNFKVIDTLNIQGFYGDDTLTYAIFPINTRYKETSEYQNVEKIVAVGDIHGDYDTLISLLKGANVIDSRLNWVFGKGHLVIIGDIFDRGDKVTQSLWLTYRLWVQAPKSGGQVHLIFGNHEWLALNNDYRYLSLKYRYLMGGLKLNYSDIYNSYSQLGTFIRTFRVGVKINGILFTHAGISSTIAEKNYSLNEFNQTLWSLLNPLPNSMILNYDFVQVAENLLSEYGPLWYRGYIYNLPNIPIATTDDVEKVLSKYNSTALVFGHTEVDSITPRYLGKVFPINVPFSSIFTKKQVLYIENGTFFRCYSNGTKKQIFPIN